MTKNSVGNITEILNLLDKDMHTTEQLANNYQMLITKWGEWEIIGGETAGISIRYVNIGNALFSGLMITFSIFTIVSFVSAILFGKIIFPMISKHFNNLNEEMVNMATLRSASQIDQMSKKEWF
jgi:hypothetical protein